MIKPIARLHVVAAIAACLAVVLTGCATRVICENPSALEVESAEDECAAATGEFERARAEREALEAEVADMRARLAELQAAPDELAELLYELRKGSGR